MGNIVDAVGQGKALLDQCKDSKQADQLFDASFFGQLPDKLADSTGRLQVLKAVGDWAAANPDAVKAAGLVIAALPK